MRIARAGLAVWLASLLACASAAAADAPDVEAFSRAGCPHCKAARDFLDDLARERPGLDVRWIEVDRNPEALRRLIALTRAAGMQAPGVPSFVVRGEFLVGFESPETTGARIRALLDERAPPGPPPDVVETRLFGALRVSDIGLPAFSLALGLVDGFNPCAMWVLLFLLSLLVNLRDRARMALVAGTFVLVSGLVYFAFMAAWLNAFLAFGVSNALRIALGIAAVGIGAWRVKDVVAPGFGPALAIPAAAKPGIYARTRAILRERSTLAALLGVAALALGVNVVELLCTAGLPAVYTAILARAELTTAQYYAHLALYNLAYVADDAVMVAIAVVTLAKTKLQERAGRALEIASAAVMLALGLALLFFPELLV